MTKRTPLSYQAAGVSIDRGNQLVQRIKPLAAATRRPGVISDIGGFGGLFRLSDCGYKNPILVSTTDGVGTKVKLAIESGRLGTIGIDLVAMCVNDLIVQGAEPLLFLDYYATGRLQVDAAEQVIRGIAEGCRLAGAALLGGETAEMPGMYHNADFDLAGFAVGAVEAEKLIDGSAVRSGDRLIGLASSGPHSNGYSLIREILRRDGIAPETPLAGKPLIDHLLEPTRIYVKALLPLFARFEVHAAAHITGGGLLENLPRVMPEDTRAVLDTGSWPQPEIFNWLQTQGDIEAQEMYRTFNCGVGMVLFAAGRDCDHILRALASAGETAWCIGEIRSGRHEPPVLLT